MISALIFSLTPPPPPPPPPHTHTHLPNLAASPKNYFKHSATPHKGHLLLCRDTLSSKNTLLYPKCAHLAPALEKGPVLLPNGGLI